jgi:hypothetical protein
MRFAKIVFWIAGIWGVVVLAPLYFMLDRFGRQNPPAITHPQFYFGFLGVALVWQFVFFVIATDPIRYRLMIALSVLEKLSYVLAVGPLFLLGHMTASESATALPDAILAVLFVIAFFKTQPGAKHKFVSR